MNLPWDISEVLGWQVCHLPPGLKVKVRKTLDDIQVQPEIGKPLEEELAGYRTYRIGKYRLIYRITKDRLILEALGSRRDIYERFILEMGRQKIREREAKYRAKVRKRPAKSVSPSRKHHLSGA